MKILMPFLSFSDNLLQDVYIIIIFQKSADNFEIVHKKCLILASSALFLNKLNDILFTKLVPILWGVGLVVKSLICQLINVIRNGCYLRENDEYMLKIYSLMQHLPPLPDI